MSGVLRALVTGEQHDTIRLWQKTAYYAHWIETRHKNGRETTLVTVFDGQRADFVSAATEVGGITVEEIIDVENEEFTLLVGAPGTGWVT